MGINIHFGKILQNLVDYWSEIHLPNYNNSIIIILALALGFGEC